MTSPNGSREDEYYWLRDDKRENPEMLAYVKAENAYADAMLAHTKALETKVYDEIIGRLKQDDSTVPYLMNGYWYYRRFETGKEYPIYARRKGTKDAPEEILLDVNEMAKGHDFFEVGDIAISPDSHAHGLGRGHGRPPPVHRARHGPRHAQGAVRIALPNVENNVVWAGDNKTFLYVEKDPETLLGYKVRSHAIDSANHADVARRPAGLGAEGRRASTPASARPRTTSSCGSPRRARCRRRPGSPTPTIRKLRLQGVPAARARPRIPGRARQWPLDRAHQLAGEELPHRRGEARRRGRPHASGSDVVAHRDDAFVDAFDVFEGFPHRRGALRRPAQAAHPSLERRQGRAW